MTIINRQNHFFLQGLAGNLAPDLSIHIETQSDNASFTHGQDDVARVHTQVDAKDFSFLEFHEPRFVDHYCGLGRIATEDLNEAGCGLDELTDLLKSLHPNPRRLES